MRERLRRRRVAIVGGVLLLVALAPLDLLAGRVIHDQRQRHLAHDVQVAATRVDPGQALLVLQIPDIGLNQVVVEGSTASDLRGGPGHVIGTPRPGHAGNAVIVGHRTRYDGPFARLGDLASGARVAVQLRSGATVRSYEIASVRRVSVDDRTALRPTNREQLTLVSLGGGWAPDGAVVVTARPVAGSPAPARDGWRRASPDQLGTTASSPAAGLGLAAVVVAGLAGVVLVGGRRLTRRYRTGVCLAVLVPVVAAAFVLLLNAADLILPNLY